MGQQLPSTDELKVVQAWNVGMPYLPLLTEEWLKDEPHPNYYKNWYLWSDLDTKATYIMMTPSNNKVLYAAGMEMPYCLGEEEYNYMPHEEHEEQYYNDGAKYTESKQSPGYAMSHWQVCYMWDATGNGYMLGNEYHSMGWWELDDCLYNMMLWDMADEYHLKTEKNPTWQEPEQLEAWANCLNVAPEEVTQDMVSEYTEKALLQLGATNAGPEVQHLNNCLQA
jgi:hypothetical protein